MSRSITLPFEGGHIALQPDERGWCSVAIITSIYSSRFGAESLAAIAGRILDEISSDGRPVGEIDGVPVINLFNVSGPHGSVYLEAASKPTRRLFFQDAKAVVVHASVASAEQIGFWESRLSKFTED